MEIAQTLVKAAYQSLGYFIIEGIKVGLKEIDLLAIKPEKGNVVAERLHVEVQIGVSPIGPLRERGALGKAMKDPMSAAKAYINKKYNDIKIVAKIKEYYGNNEYQKVLVFGQLKKPEQLEVFHKMGIRAISVSDLIKDAMASSPTHELKRSIGVFRIIMKV